MVFDLATTIRFCDLALFHTGPLASLLNTTLLIRVIPSDWKTAIVTSNDKNSSKYDCTN